jgi:glycosyltransferase involved in cell wall biosynthesis
LTGDNFIAAVRLGVSTSTSLDERPEPLVSVITPCFNREWSIKRAVKSVFAQTYRPIEYLIIDDGSTDGTFKAIQELAQEAPDGVTVRILRQSNQGANRARNCGMSLSNGEYLCFLDSDDELTPNSVEVRAIALREDVTIDLCYGLTSVCDESGRELRTINAPWPNHGEALISKYLFDTNSPMIRRAACEKAGMWREDLAACQEYEYFSRIKFHSRGANFIDEVLSKYTKHQESSIFEGHTLNYCLANYKCLTGILSLLTHSKYDTTKECFELATQFRLLAQRFQKLRAHGWAFRAAMQSIGIKPTTKAFAVLLLSLLVFPVVKASKAHV